MFEDLSIEEQVSYLKGCLPLNQFNQVTKEYPSYTEDTVNDLVTAGKETIKLQMEEGRDYWEYLKDEEGPMGEEDLLGRSYRELAYYSVAMGNSGIETTPIPFGLTEGHDVTELIESGQHTTERLQEIIIQEGSDDIENAFSSVGRDIWNVLDEYPEIRLAHFEDRNHLYLEFWVSAKTNREFHERKGEFLEFPVLRKIDCRVHFDDKLIEMRGRNDREKDRELIIKYIENIFGNTPAINTVEDDLDITDHTIRYFMDLPEFENLPHASKAGTARSNWTSDSDVRDDSEYPDHRPHNYGNIVLNLDSIGRISFKLSADDDSFRVFKHKITPQEHRKVVEYIWRNINDTNN